MEAFRAPRSVLRGPHPPVKHLHRLRPYLSRLRARYAVGLSLAALATLAAAAVPLVIKYAVDSLRRGPTGREILAAAGAIVAFAGLRAIFTFGARMLILTGARRFELELRNDVYRQLLRLPASFYDRHAAGDLTSRVINDIEGVRMMTGIGLQQVVATSLMLVMCLAGMFAISPKLALICIVPMSLITVVFAVAGPAMHRRSLAVQDQLGVVSSRAQENFSGQRVVRAFVQEDREVGRFRVECDRYLQANLSFARLRGTTNGLMTLLAELAIVATLFVGGRAIVGGTMSEGDFAAFTAYQFMLVWPMIAIGWTITLAQRGLACLQRIAELMDEKPDAAGGTATADFTAAVEFRNLTFRYDETREPALRNVSFSIARGATVAIVGRTGAGKSTLAALLTRLYPAPPGTVLIDGRDVNDLPADAQRRAVGCVPQDPFLFSDTIRENIAFGSLDGAAQTDRAAALSRIAGDAERFPQKLDQMIGERGVTLSGGQKQRTALARAIVRDPAILILDDALSSVDAHTEREILDELRGVMKGRTCIVITHRLAVARLADRVVVLDSGAVSETGTHEDLVRSGRLYAKLWTRQQLMKEITAEGAEDSEKPASESSAVHPQ